MDVGGITRMEKDQSNRIKPCLSATLSSVNTTGTGLGLEVDLYGQKTTNNRVSHDTATGIHSLYGYDSALRPSKPLITFKK
jgi:hypothetical protein